MSLAPAPASYSSPLAGMRVVDLSQQLPGPYCTLLLAGMGAHVTKIEPPAGDAARRIDPEMFAQVSAGKTSIRLDLKTEQDQQKLHGLLRDADVLVEGFRPGVTERLGCDFATVSRINPNLIYCSISGFGQTGPDATRPTHDLSLQAVGGAITPGAVVDSVGVPWVDLGTATTAALLVAAHWPSRRGIHLDLAMLDTVSSWARVKPSAVSRSEPTYGTFVAADGRVFALALLEDAMWERLCVALDLEEWSEREGLALYAARVAGRAQVRACVQRELGARTRGEILALANAYDLALDEVLDLDAASQGNQAHHRRVLSGHGGLLPFGPGVGGPMHPFTQTGSHASDALGRSAHPQRVPPGTT